MSVNGHLLTGTVSLKSYGDRRLSIAGPKLWNSVPASLRTADSFQKTLKDI